MCKGIIAVVMTLKDLCDFPKNKRIMKIYKNTEYKIQKNMKLNMKK